MRNLLLLYIIGFSLILTSCFTEDDLTNPDISQSFEKLEQQIQYLETAQSERIANLEQQIKDLEIQSVTNNTIGKWQYVDNQNGVSEMGKLNTQTGNLYIWSHKKQKWVLDPYSK